MCYVNGKFVLSLFDHWGQSSTYAQQFLNNKDIQCITTKVINALRNNYLPYQKNSHTFKFWLGHVF
jgi:hypothetical protein